MKRVTRATFSELIRRGLIGTREAESLDLMSVIHDLGASGRSAIVAIKSKWQDTEYAETIDDLNSILDPVRAGESASGPTTFEELIEEIEDEAHPT